MKLKIYYIPIKRSRDYIWPNEGPAQPNIYHNILILSNKETYWTILELRGYNQVTTRHQRGCTCKKLNNSFKEAGYTHYRFSYLSIKTLYQAKNIIRTPELSIISLKSDNKFISFISKSLLKGHNIEFLLAPLWFKLMDMYMGNQSD